MIRHLIAGVLDCCDDDCREDGVVLRAVHGHGGVRHDGFKELEGVGTVRLAEHVSQHFQGIMYLIVFYHIIPGMQKGHQVLMCCSITNLIPSYLAYTFPDIFPPVPKPVIPDTTDTNSFPGYMVKIIMAYVIMSALGHGDHL